jgi:SacI restriction endonuclease
MPIQLDHAVSRRRFQEALELAVSVKPVSREWTERAGKVGTAPNKTFTAMLGTALLAKATDAAVDPFALKTRDFPTAYSARSLCKDVLVPCAVQAGVHLGTTGREPLNNQPFFRHERIGPDMVVRPSARLYLDYLCDCLKALERLDAPQSLEALAAFLRVRLQEGAAARPIELGERVLGVPELIAATTEFVSRDPEGGRRGQALVVACFSLVFEDVRTSRVNDPSRRWPGDVVVFEGDIVTLSIEVKQRPATDTELLQFIERCAQKGIRRAVVVTLDPSQHPLPIDQLRLVAWQRYGVHLSVLEDASRLLQGALTWTSSPLEEALAVLPGLIAARLQELEVGADGVRTWAALFEDKQQ